MEQEDWMRNNGIGAEYKTKSGTREKPTKGIMGGRNRSGVIGDRQENQKADRRWVGVVGDRSGSRDLTSSWNWSM